MPAKRKSRKSSSTKKKSSTRKSKKSTSRKSGSRCKTGYRKTSSGTCEPHIQRMSVSSQATPSHAPFKYINGYQNTQKCGPGMTRNFETGDCESEFGAEQNARQLSALKKGAKFEYKKDPNMRDPKREKRLSSLIAEKDDGDLMGVYKWDSGIRQGAQTANFGNRWDKGYKWQE